MRDFLKRHGAHIFGWTLVVSLVTGLGVVDALPGRNTVDSGDIKNGQVRTPDLRNGAVTAPKLRNNAVNSAKIRDRSIQPRDLSAATIGQLTTDPCANGRIKGQAFIDADETVGRGFSTDPVQDAFNCTGEQVRVRRINTGWYEVDFGALNDFRFVQRSRCGPPSRSSRPGPPLSLSLPALPKASSLPPFPFNLSGPAPPNSVSLPTPPEAMSRPPWPSRRSLPRWPFILSAPGPPMTLSRPFPPNATSFPLRADRGVSVVVAVRVPNPSLLAVSASGV